MKLIDREKDQKIILTFEEYNILMDIMDKALKKDPYDVTAIIMKKREYESPMDLNADMAYCLNPYIKKMSKWEVSLERKDTTLIIEEFADDDELLV